MLHYLHDKAVLITGAGAGIGRAIAVRLAKCGASVMASDLKGDSAEDTVDLLDASQGQLHCGCALDVTKRASVDHAIDSVISKYGRLDILINNAGVSTMRPVESLTEDEWDFNFNVNIKGVFFMTQAALPHLKAAKGKIVNTASMASLKAAPLLAHYSATKFAVLGFTKACALEFAEYGITVNCVCPGYVETSMQERELVWEGKLRGMTTDEVRAEYISLTPLGRLCKPEDVARVVAFLASPDADYLTGEAITVSGGAICK